MTEPLPNEERGGALTHRTVALGFGVALFVAFLVSVYGYVAFLRYERVAAQHVPADVSYAARLDLEKVTLFEPVRAELLPLLNELGPRREEHGLRLERLGRAMGTKLSVGIREVLWAGGPGAQDWVLVIGGKFPSEGVVAALARIFEEDGWPWTRTEAGLEAPTGLALGQASDGVVILASSSDRLRAALPPSSAYVTLGLAPRGGGGFFWRQSADATWRESADAPRRSGLVSVLTELAAPLHFSNATGVLRLGSGVELETFVALEPGADAEVGRTTVQQVFGSRTALGSLLGPDGALLAATLTRAAVDIAGPGRLRVVLDFDQEAVSRGAEAVAARLGRRD